MAVRFVQGRAGTGKTHYCLNSIREELGRSPLAGSRLIFLVPEQVSLQMERSLLSDIRAAAAHRAEVLSFKRLTHRIFGTCGDGGRRPVSAAARTMMLGLVLRRLAPQLRYYTRAERFGGFVERLTRTLTEFIEEAVAPDDLPGATVIENDDPALALKLADLRLVYEAYLAALGRNQLDPAQQLSLARDRLRLCPWASGARVWVDGFAGFTGQERLMLLELASLADNVDITLLMGPADCDVASRSLFSRTARTLAEMQNACRERGIEIEPPLLLTDPPRRFADAPTLARIESSLFSAAPPPEIAVDNVCVIRAADRSTEVALAVSLIAEWVRRPVAPLRYRDIAVIVRSLEPYDGQLSAALSAGNIPYFIDHRRQVGNHPLVLFLRSALQLAVEDYSADAVRMLLKTGMTGLSETDADALENYLLAVGISGREKWTEGDWTAPTRAGETRSSHWSREIERINVSRRHFDERVDRWMSDCSADAAVTGERWSVRLQALMDRFGVADQIEAWAEGCVSDGRLADAEGHRQVLRDVSTLLDDIEETLRNETISLDELSVVLDAGLGQMTLALAPPTLDQVMVGTIDRSRQPDLKAVIVLGVHEGSFPGVAAEDAILNDDDRDALRDRGLSLGTPRTERFNDESILFYIAMTRACASLVVTYPAVGEGGKELRPSPFVETLLAACPGLTVEEIDDARESRLRWSIQTDRDLAARIAYEFRHRADCVVEDHAETRIAWNNLYDSARTDDELQPVLSAAVRSLTYQNTACIRRADSLRKPTKPMSISELETHAACPFKHFAQYRLKLEAREEAIWNVMDVGRVHHAILEHFIADLAITRQSIAELDDSTLDERLAESCREVVESLSVSTPISHARDRYLLDRSVNELRGVVLTQKRIAEAGVYKPRAAELKFGFDDDSSLDGLTIDTPKGRRIVLRGLIDRVDLAEVSDELLGVVIDYKRSRGKRLDMSHVYHGLSFQLLTYLLVLQEHGETLAGRRIIPAGAFYVGLLNNYERVDHPSDADDESIRSSPHRPRGLLDFDRMDSFDRSTESGWREGYSVFIKKGGELGHSDKSDASPGEDFQNFLAFTRENLGRRADLMLDGEVAVSPYRLRKATPCSWCSFRSFCRFEADTGTQRMILPMGKSEVCRLLRGDGTEATP